MGSILVWSDVGAESDHALLLMLARKGILRKLLVNAEAHEVLESLDTRECRI